MGRLRTGPTLIRFLDPEIYEFKLRSSLFVNCSQKETRKLILGSYLVVASIFLAENFCLYVPKASTLVLLKILTKKGAFSVQINLPLKKELMPRALKSVK